MFVCFLFVAQQWLHLDYFFAAVQLDLELGMLRDREFFECYAARLWLEADHFLISVKLDSEPRTI